MPTVAELDVQINAKDDASATIMALDALLKDLDGDDVDIDINANTAAVQEKIRELLAQLRELENSDPDIDVTADVARVKAEIADLFASLRELDSADPDIDIDVNTAGVRAEIDALLARLRELDASDPDIDIDINTGGASAELVRLRAELNALRDETIRIRVNSDEVRRASSDMNQLRNSTTQAGRSMRPLTAAVLALGTALIPIGAVGVGAIMSLVTAFAAAGVGAGLFAAVAITAFTPVRAALKDLKSAQEEYNKATTDAERDAALAKTKAIMDELDPSIRKMVQSVLDFKTAWRDFAEQFRPQIFQIAQEGLAGLTALLPSLAPMVQGAADAFLSLERSLISSLGSPWWQSWMTLMGSVMQPLIEGLGRSFGNLITGFAALMAAFMPLTLDFTGGMEAMSLSFANWAKGLQDNKGFQDFVAYIRENTPLVLALIGAMADAFVALVIAGAPLGEALVIIATNMFNMIAAFAEANPALATAVLAMIAIGAVVVKLTGPLLTIGRLFLILGSALTFVAQGLLALAGYFVAGAAAAGILVVAVLAIIGALIYAYFHFEAVRNIVDQTATAIATFATTVYTAIVSGLGAAATWLAATFGPAVEAVMTFVIAQFEKIRTWAHENSATFQQAWQTILDFIAFVMAGMGTVITNGLTVIQAVWTAVWPLLSEILRGVWVAIQGVVTGALDIILGTILFWAGVLAGDWTAMWDGLLQIATGMWEMIAGVFTGGFIILQAIARAAEAVLMATLQLLWTGIVEGFSAAWTTITQGATAAWTGITTAFVAGQTGIQAGVNGFWTAVLEIFLAGWNEIVEGATAAWTGIATAFVAGQTGIQAGVNGFWTAVLEIFQAGWNEIVEGATVGWTLIQTIFVAGQTGIQAGVNGFWTAVLEIFLAGWNGIVEGTTAFWTTLTMLTTAAMTGIRTVITTAMTGIQTVVTAGWNAILRAVEVALAAILDAITAGMADDVAEINNGVEQMVQAVTGAAGRFFAAGASLMENLAQGIASGIGQAVGVVGDAIGQLTSLLPGSPAKTGPLSGQGYALIRGQHLSEDLATGIASRAGMVARAAGDIADLMTLNTDSGAAFNAIARGTPTGGGGGGYTITIAPGAIVLQVGDGVTAGEAREAFDGAAASLADELLTALRRR